MDRIGKPIEAWLWSRRLICAALAVIVQPLFPNLAREVSGCEVSGCEVSGCEVSGCEVSGCGHCECDVETAIARWEDSVQVWLEQEGFTDKGPGLLVLDEQILRDKNSDSDAKFMIDSSWWLSSPWQEIIKTGYPILDLPLEPTAEALRKRLDSDVPGVRGLAMVYLRILNDDQCLDKLVEMINRDENEYVICRALHEIAQVKHEPAIDSLIELLDASQSSRCPRHNVETALQQFGASAVGRLVESLDGLDDVDEQVNRIRLIRQLGDDGQLDRLYPVVRDRDIDDRVRGQSALLLAAFGYADIIPDLIQACCEERFRNRDICLPVKEALQLLGDPAVVQIAEALESSDDTESQCNLLWALMRDGSEFAVEDIAMCLDDPA